MRKFKFIIIALVIGLNLVFFQNFTAYTNTGRGGSPLFEVPPIDHQPDSEYFNFKSSGKLYAASGKYYCKYIKPHPDILAHAPERPELLNKLTYGGSCETEQACELQPFLLDAAVFDVEYYKMMHPTLNLANNEAYQKNWCSFGAGIGRRGSKYFSSTDYESMYAITPSHDKIEVIRNFVTFGRGARRAGTLLDPNIFDAPFYQEKAALPSTMTYQQLAQHYLTYGIPRGTPAHPYFSVADYVALNPTLSLEKKPPEQIIANYLMYGMGLGRKAVKNFPYAPPGVTLLSAEENVFDSPTQGCDPEDRSDMAPRVYLTDTGQIELLAGIFDMYSMRGTTLESVKRKCDRPILKSLNDPDYHVHRGLEWIEATYTRDGRNVAAISATDWNGIRYFPDDYWARWYCEYWSHPSHESNCWWGTLTTFSSNDSGYNFKPVSENPFDYLLAKPHGSPYPRADNGGRYGFFGISNIIKSPLDSHYYFFGTVTGRTSERNVLGKQQSGTCLFRATPHADLGSPSSWKAYDGAGFSVDTSSGAPCALVRIPAGIDVRNITYNTFLQRFVIVGGGSWPNAGLEAAIRYATAKNLTDWSDNNYKARILMPLPDINHATDHINYPSLIDPAYSQLGHPRPDVNERRNFDLTGSSPYLYFTYHKVGVPGSVLKRIQVRFIKDKD